MKFLTKVTSGSDEWSSQMIDGLYQLIVDKTYRAPSIKVAEAAKVIENTQRDVNIGLVNELAMLFNRLGIDTQQVLETAATKWNFLKFSPGLVGGHCIGVDPFYLTHKAAEIGYHTEIIQAGRRINDNMSNYVTDNLISEMIRSNLLHDMTRVLILGVTFKENCKDMRNSKVLDIYERLKRLSIKCHVYDPIADKKELVNDYKLDAITEPAVDSYEVVLLAVPHKEFLGYGIIRLKSYLCKNGLFFDLKSQFKLTESDWRLENVPLSIIKIKTNNL